MAWHCASWDVRVLLVLSVHLWWSLVSCLHLIAPQLVNVLR